MKRYFILFVFIPCLLHSQQYQQGFDHYFGKKGLTTLQLKKGNFSSETGLNVFVQLDKKYIVVMEVNEHSVLARYYPNGRLDKSFGNDGYSEAVNVLGVHAVQQPDGKIVVAGQALDKVKQRYAFGLARWNRDGKLDHSFGITGMVITNFDYGAKAFAVTLQNHN